MRAAVLSSPSNRNDYANAADIQLPAFIPTVFLVFKSVSRRAGMLLASQIDKICVIHRN